MPYRGPEIRVTCYVIDVNTSYNLLLGRPWIHRKSIVSWQKWKSPNVDEKWKSANIDCRKTSVQGGRELLHKFSPLPGFFRSRRESPARGIDSDNEADVELGAEEECLWELNPLVTSINKLEVNNTANDVGKWYINEELDLTYFSVFASDFVPSDTSNDVDDDP